MLLGDKYAVSAVSWERFQGESKNIFNSKFIQLILFSIEYKLNRSPLNQNQINSIFLFMSSFDFNATMTLLNRSSSILTEPNKQIELRPRNIFSVLLNILELRQTQRKKN